MRYPSNHALLFVCLFFKGQLRPNLLVFLQNVVLILENMKVFFTLSWSRFRATVELKKMHLILSAKGVSCPSLKSSTPLLQSAF